MPRNRALDQHLETLASSILAAADEISRKSCPDCGHPNLYLVVEHNYIIIHCETPITRTTEGADVTYEPCAYHRIVHLTEITKGPFALQFREPEPPKPKRPPRRRTTR
jgi:hypothetical protein